MNRHITTATSFLSTNANRLATKAGASTGLGSGLLKIASKGLGWFGRLTPLGKTLAIGATAVGLSKAVRGHPASRHI